MEEELKTAPNAVAALVLGICSIVLGCFFVGLVCGIIGLVLANKGIKCYNLTPEQYKGYGMLNAGRILSIIGIVLNGVYIMYVIFYVIFIGAILGSGLLVSDILQQ